MRRPRPVLALAALPCALLLCSMPLAAQQVYKWKDAGGVTHYDAAPPAKGSYETRKVDDRQAATPSARPPIESAACTTARANLALLRSSAVVSIDSDADGKPDKPLDATQRANQQKLAEATMAVECRKAAPVQPDEPAQPDEPEESGDS